MVVEDDISTLSSPVVVGKAAKKAVRKCLEDEAKLTPVRSIKTPARINQNSDGSETPAGTATALENFQKKTGAETGSALLLLTEAYLKKISRPKRKVLEEDVYVKEIENIIERDFFPYLDKLRAQETFADAVDEDDVRKLQSLIAKYGRACFTQSVGDIKSLEGMSSPSTFDTPVVSKDNGRKNADGQSVRNPSPPRASAVSDSIVTKSWLMEEKKENAKGLNSFMAKVTSEDNVSFEEICTLQSIAERIKHSWIFAAEADANSALAIQNERNDNSDSHNLALKDSSIDVGSSKQSIPLDTWPYQARNMLMFNPDGIDLALQEKVDAAKKAKMEIIHANTRFAPGFLEQQEKAVKLSEHVAQTKAMMKGIVGPDGKEIAPEAENRTIAGFSIVGTPSPMPGIGPDQSPAMFWGSIEDSPAPLSERLSSHRINTPIFKIPDIPERDKIGLKLAEKAAKNHRSKKTRALNEMQSKLAHSKSPSFGSVRSSNSSISRVSAMSPAAQLLLSKRLKSLPGSKIGSSPSTSSIDNALRNSYSPKSRRFTPSLSLLGSEKSCKHITPSPLVKTPSKPAKLGKNSCTKEDSLSATSSEVSLTDNLMELKNINKRASAADFF